MIHEAMPTLDIIISPDTLHPAGGNTPLYPRGAHIVDDLGDGWDMVVHVAFDSMKHLYHVLMRK